MAAARPRTPAASPRDAAAPWPTPPSEVLLQVHAGVQLPHLGLVAVEQQGLALLGEQAVLADAPLGGLRPARMVHVRVHVGIEAVFLRSRLVPGRAGHLV